MNRFALVLSALCLSACAGGPTQDIRTFQPKIANPSAIIAAEISFNQLAQEKGQWTAFRKTVAKDAVMFVPQVVMAEEYLKGKADPPQSVKWQPHKAFMSCDGKTGATTGAWQHPSGSFGYFTTVWQFIPKNARGEGDWKWVVDHAVELTTPREPKEMIETKVASCKGGAPAALIAPAEGANMKAGYSRDQSLNYTWVVQPDGARTLEIKLWNGETSETVILDRVAAKI